MPTREAFQRVYGVAPEGVWRAPGRVNLIGEHTDYNDGFVLPFALPLGVTVAASRRDDGVLELRSLQTGEAAVSLAELSPGRVSGWAAYPAGVAWALRETGHDVEGASLVIDSDLPQGAGLSSSAALECAVALALCDLYGVQVERRELALLAQRAENDFVGMPCGIMDQSAALLCTEGNALLLDCRSGLSSQVPLALHPDFAVLVIDTRASHQLTDGGYASRRADCERAAELLGVRALRDVEDLTGALDRLDGGDPEAPGTARPRWRRRGRESRSDTLRKRVQHVVTENHRVNAVAGLLRADAVADVGALLTASHLSLRNQYEVSWPEADVAVEEAVRAGARGARMVGGGFGGSVIALVPADKLGEVRSGVTEAYTEQGWTAPAFVEAIPASGARRVA